MVKIAILGVGRWGKHLVRNFANHPQAEILAIVEPRTEEIKTLQTQLNLNPEMIMASSWEEIRDKIKLDAVVIVTPASTHYSLIRDCLDRGYHIFTEKPLTLEPKECEELCQLADRKNLQLFVDHTYLFNPAIIKGKEIITSGELGELRYGYAARTNLGPVRQDVDALWDLAIHDIAILNHWLGETPKEVQAKGKIWLQPDLKMSSSTTLGLRDLVWATLTYPSGFEAAIHLCWLNPDKQRKLSVVGSKGSLVFDELIPDSPLTLQRGYFAKQGESFFPQEVRTETITIEQDEPLRKVCDTFLNSIITQTPYALSSGWVGTDLVKILTALTQSLEQDGKTVIC